MNVINAQDYGNYDYTLRSDAKRFECGTYNIPGILALGASLKVLERVGADLVWRRINGLNAQLAVGLEGKGYRVFSSRAEGETSGILAFTSSKFDHQTLLQELEAKKIIVALREGRLRVSPHFYNSPEQIRMLVEALPGH